MSDDLKQLISESRDLIATARHLMAQQRAMSQACTARNGELCASSRSAIARSLDRLARRRFDG